MDREFQIETVAWPSEQASLLEVRHRVFVEEQNVPEEIEVDEYDPIAKHLLARDLEGSPIGTARFHRPLPDEQPRLGKVGRVAVLAEWRRHRVGSALMNSLMQLAGTEGLDELVLHAQVTSIPFYESLGFEAEGPVFREADIPHRVMRRRL